MYKKILISILAMVLIFNFTMKDYADAVVASKLATLSAKKVAKEVVEDIVQEQMFSYALMEAMEIANKYEAKDGYKVVCPSGAATCDKPVQVKETFTEADKQAVKTQSAIEIDKMVSVDGKGFSKWQKFMDWFAPVWMVSLAFTAITYALDNDVRDLFNEIGYNTLVSLGLIQPVVSLTEFTPLTEVEKQLSSVQSSDKVTADYTQTGYPTVGVNITGINIPFQNLVFEYKNMPQTVNAPKYLLSINDTAFFRTDGIYIYFNDAYFGNTVSPDLATLTVSRNGTVYPTFTNPSSVYGEKRFDISANGVNIDTQKAKSILTRTPYKIGNYYYTDILFNSVEGDVTQMQVRSSLAPNLGNVSKIQTYRTYTYNLTGVSASATIYKNQQPNKKILAPFEEFQQQGFDPVAASSYINEKNEIALIPPVALTYQEETTGETVYRMPNTTGHGYVFQKQDGTIVPEENVIPGETPAITKNPEGVPQITPTPTPTNPTPEPIPLTPATPVQPEPEIPPPTTPPGEEPPLSEYPEGEKCDAKLQFPIFSPLKEQFSTSFPFSIPWDIGRAIEAGFGDIGQTKPEFSYDFELLGEVYPITITTPKLFDDWKPFTDSLLIFIFDVSIMFGIYRFVKGGGS